MYGLSVGLDHRQDGALRNYITGLSQQGSLPYDRREATELAPQRRRTVFELEEEARANWMAAFEVEQIPTDMFRRGAIVTDIRGPATAKDFTKLLDTVVDELPNGEMRVSHGAIWYAWRVHEQGNTVGGAALYPILDDGSDPMEPLNLRKIRRVVRWVVLDRSELIPWANAGNSTPEFYVLSNVYNRILAGDRVKLKPGEVIHASRLWLHLGRPVGDW